MLALVLRGIFFNCGKVRNKNCTSSKQQLHLKVRLSQLQQNEIQILYIEFLSLKYLLWVGSSTTKQI